MVLGLGIVLFAGILLATLGVAALTLLLLAWYFRAPLLLLFRVVRALPQLAPSLRAAGVALEDAAVLVATGGTLLQSASVALGQVEQKLTGDAAPRVPTSIAVTLQNTKHLSDYGIAVPPGSPDPLLPTESGAHVSVATEKVFGEGPTVLGQTGASLHDAGKRLGTLDPAGLVRLPSEPGVTPAEPPSVASDLVTAGQALRGLAALLDTTAN